jgi:multiple sugar transport system substrate-binding protein
MSKHSFRRLSIALALGLAILPLAACGGDDSGGSSSETTAGGGAAATTEAPTDEPVTLRITWWGDDTRAAITQEALDAFTALHPNVTIEPEPKVMDGYFDSLATQIAAKDAPDVIALGGSYPIDYGKNGALVDFKAEAPDVLSAFDDSLLTQATYQGGVYGVPTGGNAMAILANKDIFDQAGVALPDDDTWTWEEFGEIATEIATALKAEGIYGAELRFEDINGTYLQQRGGALYSDDGLSVAASPEVLTEYFQMSLDLMEAGATAPAELQEELKAAGPEQTLVGQGKAAMITGYDNQIEAYSVASGGNIVLLRIPGESEYQQTGVVINPSQYWGVWSGSKAKAMAIELASFLVNDPTVGPIIGANRGMPANPDVREAATVNFTEYQKTDAEYLDRVQANLAGKYVVQPAGAQIQNDLSRRLAGDVLNKSKTPAEAAAAWIAEMQASIDEANK